MQLEPRCIRIYFVHSGVVVVQVLVNREFQIGPINFVPIHYLTTSAAVVVSIDWKCGIKQAIRLNVVLSIRSPECPSCSLSPSIQTHTHTAEEHYNKRRHSSSANEINSEAKL